MIPKIIHYCCLSEDNYPDLIKSCLKSWKTKLPDYEFVLWDRNKFDVNSTLWTKQSIITSNLSSFKNPFLNDVKLLTFEKMLLLCITQKLELQIL